jgi:hypothetical protein
MCDSQIAEDTTFLQLMNLFCNGSPAFQEPGSIGPESKIACAKLAW